MSELLAVDSVDIQVLALTMIRSRNGGKRVPFFAHPGMFRTRGVKQPDGSVRPMEDVPSPGDLDLFGADVVLTREPQYPLGGLCYVSGEIRRQTLFERGYPGQVRRTEDGAGWEPDELLIDEGFVAVNVAGKGLVLLSACSHAGIVNVCLRAKRFRMCRCTPSWVACICRARTKQSSRRPSRRCAASSCLRSPPAIAPGGAR